MRNFLSAFIKKTFFLSVFIIFIILNYTLAQTVVPFSISGTWTCPAGVTSIQVECWGGGGAGGGSNLNNGVGGGGGGGGYAQNLIVPVTPGTVYTITVGAGGAGVVAAPGGNGALSSFNSVVIARGGNGGALGSAITGIAGGPGGTAHTGTITFNGGNGGTSASARTGGGGGGAGSTGNGGNAVVNTAGLGTTIGGGNGAAGIISSGTGNIGITCGGGGSGAFGGNGANANQAGGAGARGQVVLTFTQPVCPSSTAVTPAGTQSFCLGNPANVLTATITTTGTGGTPTFLYQWYFNATNSNTVAGATVITAATSQTYSPPTAILGTRFYFCVGYATNNSCGQTSATQSLASNPVQVTVNGILPGTYSVGPTGAYSSIGAALSIISSCPITGPFIFELQPSYVSSVEIFPISIPAYTGISSVNSITIRPAAGAINLTLSTSAAGGTIVCNGGDYMIFDGRPAGLGTISQLAIINTNTAGSAVEFLNDASNNILRYCTIQGVTTSTVAGVLEFVGSTGTTGNDNNLIDFCTVKAGATTPTNIIYSAGSAGKDNSNNTISNSVIQDFFAASAACNGIFMGAATTDWTISGNSFFQTASRTFSSINARMIAIYLDNNATGNNTQILNNKIGGTSANCGGTALTLLEGTFSAIKIQGNPAASTPTVILGNTIANIALTTTSTSVNPLIYHVDGAANILSNTIGNQSTNGNIRFSSPTVFTAPSTAPILTGIMAGGALTGGLPEATIGGSVNILNNTIGGITVTAISLGAPEFRGIDVGQVFCTFAVTGNTVGSLTVANSISNDAPYRVIGIISFANKTGVIHTISNNIVANLICTNTGAAADQRIIGIQAQGTAAGGTYHVTGNTVYNLTSATSNISRAGAAGIRAVNNGAASDGTIIANKSINLGLRQSHHFTDFPNNRTIFKS